MARIWIKIFRVFSISIALVLLMYMLTTHGHDPAEIVSNEYLSPGTLKGQKQAEARHLFAFQDSNAPPARRLSSPRNSKYQRANATFVSLARNEDLWELMGSIRQVEDRFNHNYNYDWVFLNDEPFDPLFINMTTGLVSGRTKYGLIPKEHWGYPDWIDQDRARKARKQMDEDGIIYGGSESYRHMCRFESGFFWRNPELDEYKYYWRVEPSIQLHCNIDYDIFKFMADNKLKYGFTLSLYEYYATIPTLWSSTRKFMMKHPEYLATDSLLNFISEDGGMSYNMCHFWSNFEVADLDFWRDKPYQEYFDFLDREGGFFYERWGDAPVHSIGASLFLNKSEVHFFEDIGYFHAPLNSCPVSLVDRLDKKCVCDPAQSFTWWDNSCTPKFYEAVGRVKPI